MKQNKNTQATGKKNDKQSRLQQQQQTQPQTHTSTEIDTQIHRHRHRRADTTDTQENSHTHTNTHTEYHAEANGAGIHAGADTDADTQLFCAWGMGGNYGTNKKHTNKKIIPPYRQKKRKYTKYQTHTQKNETKQLQTDKQQKKATSNQGFKSIPPQKK